MRTFVTLLTAAWLLAACGNQDPAANQTETAGNITAEEVAANDLTAIDAVAAEDANIAADVNFDMNEADNAEGSAALNNGSD